MVELSLNGKQVMYTPEGQESKPVGKLDNDGKISVKLTAKYDNTKNSFTVESVEPYTQPVETITGQGGKGGQSNNGDDSNSSVSFKYAADNNGGASRRRRNSKTASRKKRGGARHSRKQQ